MSVRMLDQALVTSEQLVEGVQCDPPRFRPVDVAGFGWGQEIAILVA